MGFEDDDLPLKHPGYELFILGLSVLSIANIALVFLLHDPETIQVIQIVDLICCAILMGDFIYRLASAPDRRGYLRWGWLDFLGSLPFPAFRLFRLFRISRVATSLHRLGGPGIARKLLRDRGGTAILGVFLLTIVVLEIASILVIVAERGDPNANIRTGGDALWWAFVSVTTVGYGDRYPVTTAGRLVGSLLLIVGVGLFSTITGFLATVLVVRPSEAPSFEDPMRTGSSSEAEYDAEGRVISKDQIRLRKVPLDGDGDR